jgi:hypothetical protein
VNGEQMVGAGKMGVRQQPWMQRRVKDGIEMHEQWQLWRRAFGGVGTHTDDGAEVAALEKDIGMVGGIAQGQGPCLDTQRRRRWGRAFETMEALAAQMNQEWDSRRGVRFFLFF